MDWTVTTPPKSSARVGGSTRRSGKLGEPESTRPLREPSSPRLILVIILSVMAVLGPGLLNLVISLAILIAAINSRVIRGATIAVAHSTYVEAARALGCGHTRVILRHILPNVMATIIILATIGLGAAILAE